jgi:hypothetical protein
MKSTSIPAIFLLVVSSAVFSQERTTTANLEKTKAVALSQTELSDLIVGNTLRHSKIQGSQKLDMYYSTSGNRIFYSGGANIGMRFEGWYKIKDGKRCEQSSGGGHEVCFTLYKYEDQNYYLCDSKGQCDWTLTILKGNALEIE